MKQEVRTLLAIGLSLLAIIVWSKFFGPKPAPQEGQPATATLAGRQDHEDSPTTRQHDKQVQDANSPTLPIQVTTVESDLYKVELTNDGGVPISWQMKKFVKEGKNNGELIDLAAGGVYPLSIIEQPSASFLPPNPRFEVKKTSDNEVVYKWRSDKIELTKTYQFDPKNYLANLSVSVKNLTHEPVEIPLGLRWNTFRHEEKKGGFLGFLKGPKKVSSPIFYADGSVNRNFISDKKGRIYWAGVEDRYFLSAIIARGDEKESKLTIENKAAGDGDSIISAAFFGSPISVAPSLEAKANYSVYAGPKEIGGLKTIGVGLEKAIDYGWFSFIAGPILYLLKFFYGVVRNYGVAIILLTIFAKLIMHPLTHHSMKSMKAMQVLQPRLKELRDKYKDDKERLNMETMLLFKKHKVNPMGGCLPMLLQLPIYIALYRVLWNSIELYRAPFFWFYKDLSAPDSYFIMPVILGVFMWLQQKMTPSASADPAQAKMMQIMPVMFTAFMLFLPSGLVLYILVNTVMGVAQQWMMNKGLRLRDVVRGKFSTTAIV